MIKCLVDHIANAEDDCKVEILRVARVGYSVLSCAVNTGILCVKKEKEKKRKIWVQIYIHCCLSVFLAARISLFVLFIPIASSLL